MKSGCTAAIFTFELDRIDRLAKGRPCTDWWTPTAGSYLAQVPKARIVEAVTEAVSIEKAAPLAKLKKGEAVAAAEVLLQGTRWLPSPLRARGPTTT